jgi:photosystem II stability/assembly factor-like uncharacterized protein
MKKIIFALALYYSFFITHYSLSQSDWFPLTTGTSTALNKIQFVNSKTGWAGGFQGIPTSYAIIKTTDAGLTWTNQSSNFSPYGNRILSLCFTDTYTGYVVGADGTFKTTNGGNNFILISALSFGCADCFFLNSLTGWVSPITGISGLYKTTDGGNNWNLQNFSSNSNYSYIHMHFEDSNTGWCVADTGIYKTTNGGNNWTIQNHPSGGTLNSIFATSTSAVWIGGASGTVFSTTNGGVNWITKNIDTSYSVLSVYFLNSLTGFVSTNPRNVFKTTNNGLNWIKQMVDTLSALNSLYFVTADTGYVCGSGGKIYKTVNGGSIGIRKIDENIPDKFCLYQNFPNPFNPSTNIKYAIPSNVKRKTSNVKLIMYDLLGKEVTTLVNEKLKPGEYEFTWDASQYPSGVYFYKLISGDFSEIKKMILIK